MAAIVYTIRAPGRAWHFYRLPGSWRIRPLWHCRRDCPECIEGDLTERNPGEHGMAERVTLWSRPCNGGAGCPHQDHPLIEVEYVRADLQREAIDALRIVQRLANIPPEGILDDAERARRIRLVVDRSLGGSA